MLLCAVEYSHSGTEFTGKRCVICMLLLMRIT